MFGNPIIQKNIPSYRPPGNKCTTLTKVLKIGRNVYVVRYTFSPTAERWFVSDVNKHN